MNNQVWRRQLVWGGGKFPTAAKAAAAAAAATTTTSGGTRIVVQCGALDLQEVEERRRRRMNNNEKRRRRRRMCCRTFLFFFLGRLGWLVPTVPLGSSTMHNKPFYLSFSILFASGCWISPHAHSHHHSDGLQVYYTYLSIYVSIDFLFSFLFFFLYFFLPSNRLERLIVARAPIYLSLLRSMWFYWYFFLRSIKMLRKRTKIPIGRIDTLFPKRNQLKIPKKKRVSEQLVIVKQKLVGTGPSMPKGGN